MKKLLLILLVPFLVFGANAPYSILINNGSGITATYQTACDSNTSLCLTGNTTGGNLYRKIRIANIGNVPISVAMTVGSNSPSSDTNLKFIEPAGGGGAYDDVAVFNNLYIRSEGGSLMSSGYVVISIW